MSKDKKKNITASILQRLKNYSQDRREDRGLTLANYAIERLLYRLSISKYAEQFVLKGAQLFRIWTANSYRPTRDLDLLHFGSPDVAGLEKIFQEVCEIEGDVEDGISYLPETVKAEAIREENEYDGIRIRLEYRIGRTGEFMQVDIGFGDSVNPPASEIEIPSILNMPPSTFRAYRQETVIAEKVEAMISLGFANSRMKDFYDVHKLSTDFDFDGKTLKESLRLTFEKRKTKISSQIPLAFTKEFYEDPMKQNQWNAFLRKLSLESMPFEEVVNRIKIFIQPIFAAIINSEDCNLTWQQNEGWNA